VNDIVVLDYDPSWPQLFETLRGSIWSAVADVAIAIEHVGSTSVPGLAAKPVIDVDVVVRDADVATAIGRLTTLGYDHRGDLGISQREVFGRPPGSPIHHLYLCPESSPALANHLAIRDHLRATPGVAQAYGNLKTNLARQYSGDIDGYVQAKTGFLLAVLRDIGFPEDALAKIQRINRRPTMNA
jgi:GrpB-like predicted nucleotidyltransferase (UPF0157 family)